MFEPQPLTPEQIERCLNTISPNTFYIMVTSAIVKKEVLSTIRCGDGEKLLMDWCEGIPPSPGDRELTDDWMKQLGVLGIEKHELHTRLCRAANECTWFGPSISGIIRPDFSLYGRFNPRDRYVDNFWCNAWDEEMKINLYKAAGHVLLIHRNSLCADALEIRAKKIGVKVSYLKLDNWQETDEVIEDAAKVDAPLVIFSAGPASKFMGQMIASGGRIPKVSLDIGNSVDQWLLFSLHQN